MGFSCSSYAFWGLCLRCSFRFLWCGGRNVFVRRVNVAGLQDVSTLTSVPTFLKLYKFSIRNRAKLLFGLAIRRLWREQIIAFCIHNSFESCAGVANDVIRKWLTITRSAVVMISPLLCFAHEFKSVKVNLLCQKESSTPCVVTVIDW